MNRARKGQPFPAKTESKVGSGKIGGDNESELVIEIAKLDHLKFYDLAVKFSSIIEAEHPGYGIIFSKGENPTVRDLNITPEEEAAVLNNPHSVMAIRVKKRIELFEHEEFKQASIKETVFAKVLKICSSQLRTILENEPGYAQLDEDKDVLALWKMIRSVVTRGPASNSDPFEERLATIDRWRRFRQYESESVVDFRSRFEREVEYLNDHRFTAGLIPMDLLPPVDDATPFTEVVRDFIVEHCLLADEAIQAREFIRKLDSSRFGDLQNQLSNDRAANRDNYPDRLEGAFNLAFQYRQRRVNATKGFNNSKGNQGKADAQAAAVVDGGTGVALATVGNDLKEVTREELSKNGLCFKCGKPGHIASKCTGQKKIKVIGVHLGGDFGFSDIALPVVEQCCVSSDKENNSVLPKSWVLLDNQATVSVFGNSRLLKNVHRIDKSMDVSGVGGTISTDMVGEFAPFGLVYYHPASIGNILSFADVEDKYYVQYKKGVYSVIVPEYDRPFEFRRVNKLYIMHISKCPKYTGALPVVANMGKSVAFPVVTVAGKQVGFTAKEISRADEAVRLSTVLGFPSMHNLIHAMNHGRIINSGIDPKDVRRAIYIYGPSTASLMGKTKRSSPSSVESRETSKPPATLSDVVLCADIFFVNGLAFFIAISLRVCLVTTKYLTDRKAATVWSAVKATIAKYREHGFVVKEFRCDGEENLSCIADDLRMGGVIFNPTSKSEHEPVVERAVQTVKNTCRSILHSLPFKLSSVGVVYLVYYSTSCVNMFPKRASVSDLSPRQLVLGRCIDVSVEGRLPFGAFVHVHEDNAITNGMEARTASAIALGPCGNIQGGYRFLNLSSWRVVNRRSWTELPMPQDIINILNEKARSEMRRGGAPDGILNFSLQGNALPDEDVGDTDEDVEHLAEEDMIGDLRQLHDGEVNHSNPIEQEVLQAADAPDADAVSEEYNDTSTHEGAGNEDNEVDLDAHGVVDDAGYGSVGDLDHQPIVQTSDDVGSSTADDLPENSMSAPVTTNSPVVEPRHTYNTRFQKRVAAGEAVILLQFSGKSAVKTFGMARVSESQAKELMQMHEKAVWHPVIFNSLTHLQKLQLLYSFCFTKEKRDGSLKSRLVSIGSKQNGPAFATEVIESSSPTVNGLAMFMVLTEIAEASRTCQVYVITVDIEGAYLHADMPSDRFLSLDRDLSKILVELYPDIYRPYLSTNGRLCLKLDKALYGCVESAKLFYDHISGTLKAMGFTPNPYDICVFNGIFFDARVTVIIHVDDLLIWSIDRRGVDYVIGKLQETYKKLTLHEGPVLDYLGIELDFSEAGSVYISAERMVRETLTEYSENLKYPVRTPALPNLFQVNTSSHLLDQSRSKRFHSIVAKLLYMSKHGRPDILTSVAFLTTRVVRCTEEDERKLFRVLDYLNKFPDLRMRMTGGPGAFIKAYVDASYAVHVDGMSHSGVAIIVGDGGTVHVGSKKQKMVAKSSTEAELIALGDELSPVLFANHFREAQGYPAKPAIVYQDNQSTIALAEKGRSTSARTRHIAIRYFFVKDNIDRKEIDVQYMPTEDMLADFFTKPLQGDLFRRIRDLIMNKK